MGLETLSEGRCHELQRTLETPQGAHQLRRKFILLNSLYIYYIIDNKFNFFFFISFSENLL